MYTYNHLGAIIGFKDLCNVPADLDRVERLIDGGGESDVPCLANSMLVLLVRGVFTKLQFPYAQFPCTALSAADMFEPFWQAVGRLEFCGLKVIALVCDGLAAN